METIGDTRERTPNLRLRAERERRGWSQRKVADALNICKDMVSKWERGIRAVSPQYRDQLCALFGKNAIELGFIEELQAEKPISDITEGIEDTPSSLSAQSIIGQEASSPFIQAISQGILTAVRELGGQDLDKLRRQILTTTGTTLITPSNIIFDLSLLERFSHALSRPSSIDETTLKYLETKTADYWRDFNHDALTTHYLLGYVTEHFQRILLVLEGSLLPTSRIRLCAMASEAALLIGSLLFELRAYERAQAYYREAIRAAHEANFQELEAVAWGWMSFTWTYDKQMQDNKDHLQTALICIKQARSLAMKNTSIAVQSWLAAIEAEIQAYLHQQQACLKALDDAECAHNIKEMHLWTTFDSVKLEGYKGTCFRLLCNPEDASTTVFLIEAQKILMTSLATINPAFLRRQAGVHRNLAAIFAQQGDISTACYHASQAITLTGQAKSPAILQRLLTLRQELEPWKDTQYLKNLDEQLEPLLMPGWHR